MVSAKVAMYTRKKKREADQSLQRSADVISDLTMDVMNLILTRLPIRDAVRTSTLSKKWQYKWVSIPDIVFDEDTLSKASLEKRAHVVDQVLLQHDGPICKFSCLFYMLSCSHIDRWIAFLSRNGIKKLMLKVYEDYYDVSSSIFNCQKLCHLELFNCRLKVPPTFKGFHNLSVLNLEYIDISGNIIACLISKSPRLERLTLKAFDFDRLDINAPNLRYLDLDGRFHTLSLGSCPLLIIVSIHFSLPPDNLEQGETCNLIQFFDCLHRIERLVLKGFFIQFSSVGSLPEKLYATFEHLKYLYVDMNLYWEEILATLCIMRSSHNLKEIKIKCFYCGEEDDLSGQDAVFWVAQAQVDCLFCHLQAVEIIGICGMLLDLEFIRYILANAPVLETMKIYINNDVEAEVVSRILEELLRFRRASPQAEIIYLRHYEESEVLIY